MTKNDIAPEYIAARSALLDVLELLEPHRDAIVVIGAQAVYAHAPAETTQYSTYTTDADLAFDPDLMASSPDIAVLLRGAGYQLEQQPNGGDQPGVFRSPSGIEIDLMAPQAALQPSTRRSAILPGQSKHSVRSVHGLECALVDCEIMVLHSLEVGHDRSVSVKVAGPAALVIAKLVKIEERSKGRRDRIVSKDAADLMRLLRHCDAVRIGHKLRELREHHPWLVPVINGALNYLSDDFHSSQSFLTQLVVESRADGETPQQAERALRVLAQRLLDASTP